MKVVHILQGFSGGTSTYICTVLPELVKKGFDVTLICSVNHYCHDATGRISKLRETGVKIHIVPMRREINLLKDIRSFALILRLLSKHKFDIVHTHCSKAGALGRVAAFLTGRKVRIHSPHCFAFLRCDGRLRKSLYLGLEKMLGRLTTILVAVSQSEAAVALRSGIVPSHKCISVRNGLSNGQRLPERDVPKRESAPKTALGLDRDTQVVATACRLVEYKGVFRFLRAAELSRAQKTVFLMAGDGELKILAERFICNNRLSDKVRLLGHVSNMEKVYSVSDIVTLCSDAEAQPYLLLEAMRAKCPIIATSVIGNEELISHNTTGFLTEPTPASIADAVDELLGSKDKRHQYAENAYAYFCRHHTLKRQIAELTRIYNSST